MVTALPLAAAGPTRLPPSPNLNKDARITKAGDKAGDGDSMRVAARRRRSTARPRGCRLQGGGSCTPPAAPAAAEPASSAATVPAAPGPLRRDPGGDWGWFIIIVISRGWFGFFYFWGASFFPSRRRGSGEKKGKNLTAAPLPDFFLIPSFNFF